MMDLTNEDSRSATAKTKLTKRIKFNASGTQFEITAKSFSKFPLETRLGKLSQFKNMSDLEIELLCDEFDSDSIEFFFERDPTILQMVLNYYKTGEFHINTRACEIFVANELKYWMIDSAKLKHCCKVGFEDQHETKSDFIKISEQVTLEIQNMHKKKTMKESLWQITEFPWSSPGAMVTSFVYI